MRSIPVSTARSVPPLLRTPDQILGPFYPLNRHGRPDQEISPGRRAGRDAPMGKSCCVKGRVLTPTGRPVAGARIEVWQANSAGRYRHPSDTTAEPLDPNFDGFTVLMTDQEGGYSISDGKTRRVSHASRGFTPAAHPFPGRFRRRSIDHATVLRRRAWEYDGPMASGRASSPTS